MAETWVAPQLTLHLPRAPYVIIIIDAFIIVIIVIVIVIVIIIIVIIIIMIILPPASSAWLRALIQATSVEFVETRPPRRTSHLQRFFIINKLLNHLKKINLK